MLSTLYRLSARPTLDTPSMFRPLSFFIICFVLSTSTLAQTSNASVLVPDYNEYLALEVRVSNVEINVTAKLAEMKAALVTLSEALKAAAAKLDTFLATQAPPPPGT